MTAPLRILHVTDRLSTRGGADQHLIAVAQHQTAAGHHVELAVERVDPEAPALGPLHRVKGLASPRAQRVDLGPVLGTAPDVVHVHNVMNPIALSQLAAAGAVMTVQDHRAFCPGSGKLTAAGHPCTEPFGRETCRGCFEDPASADYFVDVLQRTAARLDRLKAMRQVIVLSDYMKRELADAGVSARRITVVPPFAWGLDPNAEPDGPPCVLFVGRLVAAKGVWDVLEAWRRAGTDLPLVFGGTGRLRTALEEAGAEVTGWLDRAALSRLYRRARALVMPSRWQEPFGIVGLEALTMGVPVVAWTSGGVDEWYPGPAIRWGDVEGLTSVLVATLNGRSAAPWPTAHQPEALMRRLREVYSAA